MSFPNTEIFNLLRLKISEVKEVSEKDYYLYINGQSIKVNKEVYEEYYYWERKEQYFMEDLKKGKITIDSETGETTIIPSREVSYEKYFNQGEPFVLSSETLEDRMIKLLELEKLKDALKRITKEEWELIWELFYLEKTERQVSKTLHIAKSTIHYKRDKILAKLKRYLEEEC